MNVREMIEDLAVKLNFNETQVDQGFTRKMLLSLLNQGYRKVVKYGRQSGDYTRFQSTVDFTWPVSTLTLNPPASVRHTSILSIHQLTATGALGKAWVFQKNASSVGVGSEIYPYPTGGTQSDIFWKDSSTLQWGNASGPSEATTFRVTYKMAAEKLEDDEQEPMLVPPEYRDLVVWEAAILSRVVADGQAPESWLYERNEEKLSYIKDVAEGRTAGSNTYFGSSDPYGYL